MLEVDDLHFSYGQRAILKGVTCKVLQKEIVALIGVSGCGKSTLFRLIMGLLSPHAGRIAINGKEKDPKCIAYMRQEDLLLPWRTVLSNLLLIGELGNKKRDKGLFKEQAEKLLDQLGLSDVLHAYPESLSGGMKQRVALARALLQNRPLLLLDEPFASLDVIVREQLYEKLKEIREKYDKTILLVTHDFRDALTLADRILILSHGKITADFVVKGSEEILIPKIREKLLRDC